MDKVSEIALLGEIQSILFWDMRTKMPSKGTKQRGDQLAYLSGEVHKKVVDPQIGKLLKDIQNHVEFHSLTDLQKRNIYLIQRNYDRETKVPNELVQEITKHRTKSYQIWTKAREESNFDLFKPILKKMIDLQRQRANYIDSKKPPYEIMLDDFEPGFTSALYTELYVELKAGLVPLIQQVLSSPNQPDLSLIKRHCPIPAQQKLEHDVLPIIGYDIEAGRLDTTVHPFTSGFLDDVRITTRYDEEDFASSFLAVMHESGHAIYGQNSPREYHRQPISDFCSYGIHESQSRFFENMIGRSPEFWEFFLPKFKKITEGVFDDVELKSFVHALNKVENSFIRVEADELTYSLHIILRYEMERDIFAGKIAVEDLPRVWNAKMKDYFGLDVPNDAQGLLQDPHWANGNYGYFPNYALGNLYGAQLLNQLAKDIPDWKEKLRQGDVLTLKDWLVKNIHQLGNRYDPLDLIKHVTGEELTPKYFLKYLREKYSQFYKF